MLPKCEPLAPNTKEEPQTRSTWATPSVLRTIWLALTINSSVRSRDAESGSWTAANR